jgi:NADP-dependent 3-hydroxy acid dehydrogenase YdfG
MERVIVITGASSGIGAATARLLAQKSNALVLAARRLDALENVAAGCGEHALAVVTDVTRRADHARLVEAAIARFGRIDVYINNAGRGITKRASDLTDEDFDEMILVNTKSVLYGMQAVLPHMKSRKRGHIINVSSMLGRIPFASFRSAYNAAKHAMMSLTANFRADLRAEYPDIRVSAFIPGIVATDFGLNAKHGGPDSRTLPFAQPVEEVALALADLIEHPRAEAFSRPMYKKMVADYYAAEDLDAVESKPPWV